MALLKINNPALPFSVELKMDRSVSYGTPGRRPEKKSKYLNAYDVTCPVLILLDACKTREVGTLPAWGPNDNTLADRASLAQPELQAP